MVISTCASGRASLTTCLLRRLVGGRIDAIGLSVVMPEGPRRIPGRLSVAPASPAVSKNSGTYILSASSPFGFWLARVSRLGAVLVARALRRRDGSLVLRTPDCGLGASSKRPRIRQRPSLSARRQFRRHSPESHRNCRPLALVSHAYGEILETRPSVRLRRRGAFARFAEPQDRYPKAILMPIRELMTSPSEKPPWRNRRS
jgi:hypothetical protein